MGKINRKPLLTALCILSFAGNGIAFLVYLFAAILNRQAREYIGAVGSVSDKTKPTPLYFGLFALLYAISFFSVVRMWNLKRAGFAGYFAAQTAILFLPVVWPGAQAFSSVAVIFTLLFLVLYGISMQRI